MRFRACRTCGAEINRTTVDLCRLCEQDELAAAPEPVRAGRRDRGRSYILTEHQIAWGHSRHLDGWSARAVARELITRGAPGNEKSVLASLLSAWRARGWEVRSQSRATAQENMRRGFRPRCSHVFARGAKRGLRCPRRSVGEGGTCWKHDPARIAANTARLRSGVPA